jgi:two-component system, NarL family, response regulator NreC
MDTTEQERQERHERQERAPIRVLLADDHDIVREGLRALLGMAGDIAVVGEARTGREAVAEAERLLPHVVLMDISMPELDGVEACARIRQQAPDARVLFLTMHEAEEYFFRALRAGAAGYVIKRTAAADLIAAVRAVARGDAFLSPGVAHALLSDYAGRAGEPAEDGEPAVRGETDRYNTLSGREKEVLKLVAEGHTNQEIAALLTLSIKTVQAHRAAAMDKLGLRDVTHLVRYAVRRGLVDPER